MNRQRSPAPATFWGPIIDAELTAIRTAADPGEPAASHISKGALQRDGGARFALAPAASRETTPPRPSALARADAVCGRLNRVLLVVAILLGAMVLALGADRTRGALLLRHPGWFGPAFDLERGIYPGRAPSTNPSEVDPRRAAAAQPNVWRGAC